MLAETKDRALVKLEARVEDKRQQARVEGEAALVRVAPGIAGDLRPIATVALVGGKPFALGYVTKARVLYFFMGLAAALFIAADVIAEFDKDPSTHTATSYVKKFRKTGQAGAGIVFLSVLWLMLHFMVDGFPL
jgi:hypothetical protein